MRADVRNSIFSVVKQVAQVAEDLQNSANATEQSLGDSVECAACALQDKMYAAYLLQVS
jgi:hypothetical protein